jgi:hypothetical protein
MVKKVLTDNLNTRSNNLKQHSLRLNSAEKKLEWTKRYSLKMSKFYFKIVEGLSDMSK